jgi:hypothetical protein
MNYAITYSGIEGFDVMFGASKTNYAAAGATDDTEQTGTVKYTMGALSAAYQMSSIQSGTASTAGETVESYGVAFNVNDNLSISMGVNDNTSDTPSGDNVTEESSSLQAAYTMGSASFRMAMNSADNVGGTAGVSDDNLELSLKLSF